MSTNRLVLRKLCLKDSVQMFDNWGSDSKVTKFLTWKPYKNIDSVNHYLSLVTNNYCSEDYFHWGIEIKDTHTLIGTISVVNYHKRIQTMEIGYAIGRRWWNQGYTSEALSEVVNYLFAETTIQRIEAFHDTNNPNSGLVLNKCQFVFEGILRKRGKNNCGIFDECIYSILRQESTKTAI
nr:GNAT family N-acetyltransferase [Melissococcus plutonius]